MERNAGPAFERRRGSVNTRVDIREGYRGPRREVNRLIVRDRPRFARRIIVNRGRVCKVRVTRVRSAYGTRIRKVRVCR